MADAPLTALVMLPATLAWPDNEVEVHTCETVPPMALPEFVRFQVTMTVMPLLMLVAWSCMLPSVLTVPPVLGNVTLPKVNEPVTERWL